MGVFEGGKSSIIKDFTEHYRQYAWKVEQN